MAGAVFTDTDQCMTDGWELGHSLTQGLPGQAPAPGKASAREAADIVNIIEARAGAVTRSNTLFLAAVGARVDWIADLGKDGRHVGRFPMEQFISDAFNESSAGGTAWLGNPQAVGADAVHLSHSRQGTAVRLVAAASC